MPRNSYPAAAMVRSVPFARARASVAVCRRTPRSRRGAIARVGSRAFSVVPGAFFYPRPRTTTYTNAMCVYIYTRTVENHDRSSGTRRDHAAFLLRGTGRGRLRRFFRLSLCVWDTILFTHTPSCASGTPRSSGTIFHSTRLGSARLGSTRLGVSRSRTMAAARRRNATDRDGRHIATRSRSRSRIHRGTIRDDESRARWID